MNCGPAIEPKKTIDLDIPTSAAERVAKQDASMKRAPLELTQLEVAMILSSMAFVEAGEWPWAPDMDGTSAAQAARQRAAFDRAREKLFEYKPRRQR